MTILFMAVLAQAATSPEKAMDFWLGDWKCEGQVLGADGKSWSETKGTNHIERILDGKVIHENFKSGPMRGESWSVYVPRLGGWRQTWVDSQGGYIPLAGGVERDGVTLTTLANPNNTSRVNHMTFSEIKPNSFTWRWESSQDGGKSWQLQWILHYTKTKPLR